MYTKKERIAIARIVSDMIKADNIIEESEIEMLRELKAKYAIDNDTLKDAHRISFSEAVGHLSDLSDEEKLEFFGVIRKIANSDGACVPREALLLLALRYALGIKRKEHSRELYIEPNCQAKLLSCPTGDNTINNQYVIYIEGDYNDEVNRSIKESLEVNVLDLRQLGFDFVYIPSLIKEFSSMNGEYVKDVIQYMAPELDEKTISTVYDRLLHMDTVKFCNYVLADKLHVEAVKKSNPALLVNIGTSYVPYCSLSGDVNCYTEFLCIPVDGDFRACVRDFIKSYKKLVSYYTAGTQVPENDANKFKYFGFYKAMFDFLVKAEPKEYDICVLKNAKEFVFLRRDTPGSNKLTLVLKPQEAAIYKLILHCKIHHPKGGLPTAYTASSAEEIKRLYQKIYGKGGDLPYPLAPVKSCIEKKIRDQLSTVANVEDYIPRINGDVYTVSVRPDHILLTETGQLGDRKDWGGAKAPQSPWS